MVIAQAIVEHGLLDSMSTGIRGAFDQLGFYVTEPWFPWFGVGLIIVLAWFFLRSGK